MDSSLKVSDGDNPSQQQQQQPPANTSCTSSPSQTSMSPPSKPTTTSQTQSPVTPQAHQQPQQPAQATTSPSATAAMGPARPPVPAPALPPQLAHNAGKSVDEILADLNKSPLFMTELDDEQNTGLEALEALSYEGTMLENATDFKGSGNEAFREKRWPDAADYYGRGIGILVTQEKRRAASLPPHENDPQGDDPVEIAAQRTLLETLYVNRAACHLERRNYRSCYLDCHAALRLNPRNLKAWYRSARALLAVGKIGEADDACAGGLAVDPENNPLRAVAREIIARAEADAAKTAADERARLEMTARDVVLRQALQARHITVRRSARPPDMGDAKMELVAADATSTTGTTGSADGLYLTFPAVLLYPVHYESDFIKAFSEKESLMQHFGYVFPLPWDREGEYSASGVECFMETTVSGGLVRVGKKVALLKVLSMDNVEVVDGVVKIYVVPKAKAEGWVKEFKAAKAKEREREGSAFETSF
ncbi:hypothetical protein BD289DRAFT_451905 [Coniella lustricola]|uniref:Cns1/TTC4 wheel domain-containing protein n=1 Tax=Coniella lustricola TaxID=2025994 RepID=A0A2T3AD13_9PEZI|nr:hypothetical protein BD289DRAFT_451905 [Coniella lustricola]